MEWHREVGELGSGRSGRSIYCLLQPLPPAPPSFFLSPACAFPFPPPSPSHTPPCPRLACTTKLCICFSLSPFPERGVGCCHQVLDLFSSDPGTPLSSHLQSQSSDQCETGITADSQELAVPGVHSERREMEPGTGAVGWWWWRTSSAHQGVGISFCGHRGATDRG